MLGQFLRREVALDGSLCKFSVYVPPELPANPPAILFLHGRGESGEDGDVQTQVGLGAAIRSQPERWPFLVVFPQKADLDTLWPGYLAMLEGILSLVDSEFAPNPKRRYLTGLSQGGNGTLELVDQLSWRFAAMTPICGWCDPHEGARKMAETPTWIFHGEDDEVVRVSKTTEILDCCAEYGANPKVSIYPGVDHNSWDRAYAEPLPEWFGEHRLP